MFSLFPETPRQSWHYAIIFYGRKYTITAALKGPQVTVTSNSNTSLKPLLESAIRSELKALTHGINRTRERLAAFEKQFGMSSDEFERRFKAGEVDETLDFINTDHFPGLPNFPHHKHAGNETNVLPSAPPDFSAVLKEIEPLIAMAR